MIFPQLLNNIDSFQIHWILIVEKYSRVAFVVSKIYDSERPSLRNKQFRSHVSRSFHSTFPNCPMQSEEAPVIQTEHNNNVKMILKYIMTDRKMTFKPRIVT